MLTYNDPPGDCPLGDDEGDTPPARMAASWST